MNNREPMASTTRSLWDVWHEITEHPEIAETLDERRNLMDSFVSERILGYVMYYINNSNDSPLNKVGEIVKSLMIELRQCEELYSELELRRMVGQETAFALEELKKEPLEAFRVGSRNKFLDKHLDENYSPDLIRGNLAELKRTVDGWRGAPAVGFGIRALDECFGGIYPGDIAVLVGGPGSMKSSLALNAVEDFVLRTDQFCIYYSLDMPPYMITERLALRECRMSEREFRLALADGMPQATEAMREVSARYSGRMAIKGHDMEKNLTVDSLLLDVAARRPGLVLLDYLTRLKPEGLSDLEFVEPAMNKIHRFAAMYQIPFLVLSQMSRASRSDQASGHKGGHSRGGGIVEELAFTEIELEKHHLQAGDNFQGDTDPIVATVTKARHGISGRSYFLKKYGPAMLFTGEATRIKEVRKSKNANLESVEEYLNSLNG